MKDVCLQLGETLEKFGIVVRYVKSWKSLLKGWRESFGKFTCVTKKIQDFKQFLNWKVQELKKNTLKKG